MISIQDTSPGTLLGDLILGINQRLVATRNKPRRYDSAGQWYEVDDIAYAVVVPGSIVQKAAFWSGLQIMFSNIHSDAINAGVWIKPPANGTQFTQDDTLTDIEALHLARVRNLRAFTAPYEPRQPDFSGVFGALCQKGDMIGEHLIYDLLYNLRELKWVRLMGSGGSVRVVREYELNQLFARSGNASSGYADCGQAYSNAIAGSPDVVTVSNSAFSSNYRATGRNRLSYNADYHYYSQSYSYPEPHFYSDGLTLADRTLHYVINHLGTKADFEGLETIKTGDSLTLDVENQHYHITDTPLQDWNINCNTVPLSQTSAWSELSGDYEAQHYVIVEGHFADLKHPV